MRLVAVFTDERDLLAATRAAREAGLQIEDAYTPYAVHGLDQALGQTPTRLPIVCFLCGLFGAAFILWFQFWTSAADWPLNVGGKPFNSLPAFVPVTFEMMVLFGGLGSVLAAGPLAALPRGHRPAAGRRRDRRPLRAGARARGRLVRPARRDRAVP